METPHKFIITLVMFWIVLGGLFQIFGLSDENESKLNPDTSKSYSGFTGKISFIWDMMTFNVTGAPEGFRINMNLFMFSALAISIYVLLRSGS